jgi:large subunit ribosomal protein L11
MNTKVSNVKIVKLQILAGKATPSSSIGPALGQHGINIMNFCKEFNSSTKDKASLLLPTIISIYPNKKYSFIVKEPPTSVLIKKMLDMKLTSKPGSGSATPGSNIVGCLNREQLNKIVDIKYKDLNCYTKEAALNIIIGTAKSMGVNTKL